MCNGDLRDQRGQDRSPTHCHTALRSQTARTGADQNGQTRPTHGRSHQEQRPATNTISVMGSNLWEEAGWEPTYRGTSHQAKGEAECHST